MKLIELTASVRMGLALALLVGANAQAAEGNFEINQDCVAVGCFTGDVAGYPVTINTPGAYVLSSNLAPPGNVANSAIEIAASNVDLDLNGHTIDGGGSCVGTPVTACSAAQGASGVTISSANPVVAHVHHGTIRGFNDFGVRISNAGSGTLFDHLLLTENGYGIVIVGASAATNTRIENSAINRNGQSGIVVSNGILSRLLVENCEVSGNLGVGMAGGPGSSFINNRISSNGATGLNCNPAGTAVCALGRNTFYGNATGGSNPQFEIPVLRDMGGNVCLDDGTCP